MPNPSAAEIAEIDLFLSQPKWLDGPHPDWTDSRFFRRGHPEYQAIWPIADDLGIVGKGQLRFAFRPWNRERPSISVIYGQRVVSRLDFDEVSVCKFNPPWAESLGLPPRVCGNHIHKWEDNRAHVLAQEIWELPCRAPLPPQVRKIDQGLGWLADYANIRLAPDQYGFDVPQGVL
jgi:hypothetical protein